jgi:hypothetical protein
LWQSLSWSLCPWCQMSGCCPMWKTDRIQRWVDECVQLESSDSDTIGHLNAVIIHGSLPIGNTDWLFNEFQTHPWALDRFGCGWTSRFLEKINIEEERKYSKYW